MKHSSLSGLRAIAISALVASVLVAQAPVEAQLSQDGTALTATLSGQTRTIVKAQGRIVAHDLATVSGSASFGVRYTVLGADGVERDFDVISVDGRSVSEPRAISGTINLRYGSFDPLQAAPSVTPSLDGSKGGLWLVQFTTREIPAYRDAIRSAGGTLGAVIHNHARVVRAGPQALAAIRSLDAVRSVGPFHPAFRMDETLLSEQRQGFSSENTRRVNIMTIVKSEVLKEAVGRSILSLGGEIVDWNPNGIYLTAELSHAQVTALAHTNEVLWMDLWTASETDMDIARDFHGATLLANLNPTALNGEGVRGEVLDSGTRRTHQEFQARPLIQHGSLSNASHGTSTYGQVFASGVDNSATGMLPQGQGIASAYTGAFSGGSRYNHTGELVDPAGPYRAVFQTNSWGGGRTLNYTSVSAEMDDIIFDHDLLITQSQSNAGDQMSRPQAWSKNIVSVGGVRHSGTATRNDDRWGAGASIGPARDGRLKPDLASFYDQIRTTSNTSDTAYTNTFGGTSGATPITAGVFGLFYQMWSEQLFGNPASVAGDPFANRPSSTTAKAMVINDAQQWDFNAASTDLIRVHQGWGNGSVGELYNRRDRMFWDDETTVLAPGAGTAYNVIVDPGESSLRLALTWRDAPGTPNTLPHRVIDMDLRAISPSGVRYLGNVGLTSGTASTSGGAANVLDTVERIIVDNPEVGTWRVEVIASDVPVDNHTETPAIDADFALVVSGVRPGPPAPPPFDLELVTSGGGTGDLSVALTNPPASADKGYILYSFATANPVGTGQLLGINPDLFTLQGLALPETPGLPFNFPMNVSGIFPDVPFALGAGSLPFSGSTDGVALLLDGSGGVSAISRVVRVNW